MPVPPKKKTLSDKLKNVKRMTKVKEPLWKGPTVQGVTQSLLAGYMVCKERARVRLMLGLSTPQRLVIPIEYGNMWHACEEASGGGKDWRKAADVYTDQRISEVESPKDRKELDLFRHICKYQYEVYLKYWRDHVHVTNRIPLYEEEEFGEMILLPSGRYAKLRGKWDLVDVVSSELWLQENKTKGRVMFAQLFKQLRFDLQTMTYIVALRNRHPDKRIAGIRYNVVKRPLSGGKGSIRPKKDESMPDYLERLGEVIKDNQSWFFTRQQVSLDNGDIQSFCKKTLYPVLENIVDDYEWWDFCLRESVDVYDNQLRSKKFPHHANRHFRMPYGVSNKLLEGGSTPFDNYLDNGSIIGLVKVDRLFPELNED